MNPNLDLLELVRAPRTLLWVDDNPSPENQFIISQAEEKGIRVLRETSTASALTRFASLDVRHFPQSHLRVMSNMTRREDGSPNTSAGLMFAVEIRKLGYLGPIMIFCANVEVGKQKMAEQSLVSLTDDIMVAMSYAVFDEVRLHFSRVERLRSE